MLSLRMSINSDFSLSFSMGFSICFFDIEIKISARRGGKTDLITNGASFFGTQDSGIKLRQKELDTPPPQLSIK
jgi:hypothetical protein